jgi:flagellar basal body-associated protein FliL
VKETKGKNTGEMTKREIVFTVIFVVAIFFYLFGFLSKEYRQKNHPQPKGENFYEAGK